jgi:DNA-binding LacI/PurR family transcriptional regulator
LNLFGLEVSEAIDRKEIVSKQKVEEVKAALRELGLDPEVKS